MSHNLENFRENAQVDTRDSSRCVSQLVRPVDFELSFVDDDIREYVEEDRAGRYVPNQPILLQISRQLRGLLEQGYAAENSPNDSKNTKNNVKLDPLLDPIQLIKDSGHSSLIAVNSLTEAVNLPEVVFSESHQDSEEIQPPLSPPSCSLLRFFGFGRSNNKRVSEIIYKPEEDITVLELARIVPLFDRKGCYSLKSFPDSVLRHFEFEGNRLTEARIQQLIKEGRI